MPAASNVDEYLSAVPQPHRAALDVVRRIIADAAPQATETIAYGMPAFRVRGSFLVSYAAYKKHCSVYPVSDDFLAANADPLKPHYSGRGTFRFDPAQPVPEELLRRLVEERVREVSRTSA